MQGRSLAVVLLLAVVISSMALVTPLEAAQTVTTTIKPTDNAYVVADLNDNGTDKLGFRSLNTGSLPILKVWYAWNLTIVNKNGTAVGYIPVKIVSVAYFKFDLTSLAGAQSVSNATLRVYAQNVNLTGASRFLVAYSVPSTSWTQGTLTWYTAPGFNTRVNSSGSVTNGLKQWYSIDLTKMANNATGKEFSVAVTFLVLYKHNEEQAVFNSTRASGGQPYLAITYVGTPPGSDLAGFLTSTAGPYSVGGVPGGLLLIILIVVVLLLYWYWRRSRVGVRQPSGKPQAAKPKQMPAQQKGPPPSAAGTGAGGMAMGAKCPNCGSAVEPDFKLCPNCGKELSEKVCGNCGKSMKMEFKVCPYCGNKTG